MECQHFARLLQANMAYQAGNPRKQRLFAVFHEQQQMSQYMLNACAKIQEPTQSKMTLYGHLADVRMKPMHDEVTCQAYDSTDE